MQHPSGLLTIDLSAIQRNWLRLRSELSAGAECGAVVKANAYGLGMVPVAQALQLAGCKSFFVVNLKEALELRRHLGAEADIYLLQGVNPQDEPVCLEQGLVPVLINFDMAQRWLAFCESNGLSHEQRRSALKINTGMNRLGLELDELQALIKEGCLGKLGCELLMSHLACADQPGHPLNKYQLDAFTAALAQARQDSPKLRASLANSAATLRGQQWHFDLVRPGISLYGGNPLATPSCAMQPVVTLQLPVAQSRCARPGSAVGYGATYITEGERHLVSVSGGYGDGIFRSLSNKGSVWFGRTLPMTGRVSMDSLVVDVTDLPEPERPREGDRVELLGPHLTIDAVAEAAGTIAYEVITRLTGRYDRQYIMNNQVVETPLACQPPQILNQQSSGLNESESC